MSLAVDSVIQHTLGKMTARIVQKAQSGAVANEQSGLLYLGNVHDAIPRQLYMDTRLSPLDKTAWVMIRLYAQQNDGAVFPTYEELQLQLASPHAGKASRETVSRALLMLRLTGWLSLCKRVRDDAGRVRGNIYAQHDEPLGLCDAEYFDPGWLDAVAKACLHSNKTVRLTALSVLNEIKQDTSMRHRHSRVALIEARLSAPQSPQALALRQQDSLPGSDSELSMKREADLQGSESELSLKTMGYDRVRNPNRYVRSSTQCVKDTYVGTMPGHDNRFRWPSVLIDSLTTQDRDNVESQLQALPGPLGQQVLDDVAERVGTGEIKNVIAYLLATLKRARNGQFNAVAGPPKGVQQAKPQPAGMMGPGNIQTQGKHQRASAESIARVMAEIRAARCTVQQ
ncbi:STY4528 family pathogenicity island replication protein [Klebsiella oxytoca]|uniref:STY4528 family pathogenicity island replication protein n=1 Tax=Klebsiella oxytoca TaxID=571 RepID=UPI0039C8DF8B